jgi:hypothetical protein
MSLVAVMYAIYVRFSYLYDIALSAIKIWHRCNDSTCTHVYCTNLLSFAQPFNRNKLSCGAKRAKQRSATSKMRQKSNGNVQLRGIKKAATTRRSRRNRYTLHHNSKSYDVVFNLIQSMPGCNVPMRSTNRCAISLGVLLSVSHVASVGCRTPTILANCRCDRPNWARTALMRWPGV